MIFLSIVLFLSKTHGKEETKLAANDFCPDNGGFYANAVDCTKYFVCDHNRLVSFNCGPGTQWDNINKNCGYMNSGGCRQGQVKPPEPEQCDPLAPLPSCPDIDPRSTWPIILPHQFDCTRYYICDKDELQEKKCPRGLYFNPTLHTCDLPRQAGCLCANLLPHVVCF